MLGEGVHPMSVERAATQAGYPVGTLQLSDELNMELMAKIAEGHRRRRGRASYVQHPGDRRRGDDDQGGSPGPAPRRGLLRLRRERSPRPTSGPASRSCSRPTTQPADIEDLKDRYLFIEAIETAKCFEEGVIESAAAANIGSIMGIGYPALTGGTVQFMQGYDGRTGQRPRGLRRPGQRAGREVRRPLHPDRQAGRDGGEGRVLPRPLDPTARAGVRGGRLSGDAACLGADFPATGRHRNRTHIASARMARVDGRDIRASDGSTSRGSGSGSGRWLPCAGST